MQGHDPTAMEEASTRSGEMMFRAGGALLSHRHIISSFCATWITAAGKMEWNVGKFNRVAAAFVQTLPFGHASYAMNLFFKAAGKHPWDCHFNGTGIVVTQDPCKSPVEILALEHSIRPCN
ncbi:hypothetical protein OIU78_015423 [Salix suchowensis]|nr:hypothetical protein OIU78_015423 [Salix suchowensis]